MTEKKEKIKAEARRVNTQLKFKIDKTYNQTHENNEPVYTDKNASLGSIKNELYKSLIVATLILTSLVVVYWFS